jgi:cephalosporin-C deacetylase
MGGKMPLLFDMPYDQLSSYRGTNPCPQDFDQYWDDALKEIDAMDPQVEFIKASFQAPFAECYHLYFTGCGGARIHVKYLKSLTKREPHPAVLFYHGYAGNSGDWTEKLSYAANGFCVAAMDCRGQGGESQDKGGMRGGTLNGHIIRGLDGKKENLLFRQIFLDTAVLARIIMNLPEVDEDRIGATGYSQGGGLTLACGALVPQICRLAPVYPFLCDYQRVWRIDLAQGAYAELKDYFRSFDPLHDREEEVFIRLGYIDVQNLCSRINAKVFMGTGLADKVCPPSTQFAAYNKIKSEKSVVFYPDFGHEALPGHQDAIFQFMSELLMESIV